MDKYAYPIITKTAFIPERLGKEEILAAKAEYKSGTKEALYAYANERKILPFVADLAIKLGLDCEYWITTMDFYRERNAQVIKVLDQLFKAFEKNGVKKCFLSQNFGALLASGRDIALFASGDVDMCGVYEEKEAIEKTFCELGYSRKDRYCGKRQLSSEYFHNDLLDGKFGIGMEYVTISRMKLPEPIHAEDFVDFEKLVRYADTSILLPSIDALTYICLVHISLHSFSRAPDIRLYIDIENCLFAKPKFETVLAYAKKDKTMVRVLAALLLTQKLFGVELPKCVKEAEKQYEKRIHKLMKLVYDEKKRLLIYEPSRINTLKIELNYYDSGSGIKKMLFPDKLWKKETYGNGIGSAFKHILKILR